MELITSDSSADEDLSIQHLSLLQSFPKPYTQRYACYFAFLYRKEVLHSHHGTELLVSNTFNPRPYLLRRLMREN
jgi:hypothetical protein